MAVGCACPGDLAPAGDLAGAQRDLVLAAQRLPGPHARGGDLAQVGLGGGQQRFAFAGPLGLQERGFLQATSRSPGSAGALWRVRSNRPSSSRPPAAHTSKDTPATEGSVGPAAL